MVAFLLPSPLWPELQRMQWTHPMLWRLRPPEKWVQVSSWARAEQGEEENLGLSSAQGTLSRGEFASRGTVLMVTAGGAYVCVCACARVCTCYSLGICRVEARDVAK